MKKIYTAIIALMLFATFAKAQTSGGPDAFGYIWRTSDDAAGPTYNWIDINGLAGTVDISSTLTDDNLSPGTYPITIPFRYYWYDPTSFRIGSNGYIIFSGSAGLASPFPNIPSTAGQQNYIAPMAADLLFSGIPAATCKYWQSTDSLIVTWENVPFWDAAGSVGNNTFQVILSAVDSSITFQYFDQTGVSASTTNFVTCGIENLTGAVGLLYQRNVYPLAGTAVKIYYPANSTFAVNDAAADFVNNPGNRGIFRSQNGAPFVSSGQVKNTGNQQLNSFNVYSRVLNTTNAVMVSDTIPTSALAPNQTEALSFPDTWVPTVTGVYRQVIGTLLTGDANNLNNTGTMELQVVDTTQQSISLAFDNGTAGTNALSWQGGGGGVAVHFIPPFYPCYINAVGSLVGADPSLVGYSMQVFADDGPNGTPSTKLDSIFIASGAFTEGVYNENPTSASIQINSGGFYVAWMMGGPDVQLGQDDVPPISLRSYEVLGAAADPNSWAEYRDGETQDPIIHAVISRDPLGVNVVSADLNDVGQFFPNPTSTKAKVAYSLEVASDVNVGLYDLQGKLLTSRSLGKMQAGAGSFEMDVKSLESGVYICKINVGTKEYKRKITVVK